MSDIHTKIAAVREQASFFVTKRRRDIELYDLLSKALALCEEAEQGGHLEDLRQVLTEKNRRGDRNRTYANAGSDVYLLVGRLVFEREGDTSRRACAWRYTAAMREAHKRGVRSDGLVEWLRENGGINTLFRGRPVAARSAITKTLHLNQPIAIPKGEPVTIRIQRDARGFFDVLDIWADIQEAAE